MLIIGARAKTVYAVIRFVRRDHRAMAVAKRIQSKFAIDHATRVD